MVALTLFMSSVLKSLRGGHCADTIPDISIPARGRVNFFMVFDFDQY